MRSKKSGASLIELVMVMMILALFGFTIYTVMAIGVGTQQKIMDEKDAQTDARIALSYINVRLRQNDSMGMIDVRPIGLTGQNAIVVHERTDEYDMDTWIYFHNNALYECLVLPGEEPQELFGFHIADIGMLDIVMDTDSNTITCTVYYEYGGLQESLSATVFLRSYNVGR